MNSSRFVFIAKNVFAWTHINHLVTSVCHTSCKRWQAIQTIKIVVDWLVDLALVRSQTIMSSQGVTHHVCGRAHGFVYREGNRDGKWEDCTHAYGGFTFALDLNTSPVQIPVDNPSLHLYLTFPPSFTSIYNHHRDGGERWSTAWESSGISCNLCCLNIKYTSRKPPALGMSSLHHSRPNASAMLISCHDEQEGWNNWLLHIWVIFTSDIWMLTSYPG